MTIEAQTERWRRLLQSLMAGRGQSGQPITCLDDILPVISIIDPEQTEQHLVRGEVKWSWGDQVAGGAGTFGMVLVQNPADSGAITVVEHVSVAGLTSTGFMAYVRGASPLPSAVTPWPMDVRSPGAPQGILIDYSVPKAAVGVLPQMRWFAATAAPQYIVDPSSAVVLKPGVELVILAFTANVVFAACVDGYSRQAEKNEIQGF